MHLTATYEGVNGTGELFFDILKKIVEPFRKGSIIDLCCCNAPYSSALPFEQKTLVDIRAVETPLPHCFIQTDVLGDHPIFEKHYDVSVSLDGIEHLTMEQAPKLIERMETISDVQIIFTPLDPWCMSSEGSEDFLKPESHKCVWQPEMLPDWSHLVFPQYHPTLDIGAFFSWKCPENMAGHHQRVKEWLDVRVLTKP